VSRSAEHSEGEAAEESKGGAGCLREALLSVRRFFATLRMTGGEGLRMRAGEGLRMTGFDHGKR
jgi:hypothetical protein